MPSTPGGILAKMLREVADSEATPGLRFKVVEKGGNIFKTQESGKILMNSKSEWRQPSLIEMREEVIRREVGGFNSEST